MNEFFPIVVLNCQRAQHVALLPVIIQPTPFTMKTRTGFRALYLPYVENGLAKEAKRVSGSYPSVVLQGPKKTTGKSRWADVGDLDWMWIN